MEINQYDITLATHYDITISNDIARDAYCEITMANGIARDIHCDVTMSNDVASVYIIAMNHIYYVFSARPLDL